MGSALRSGGHQETTGVDGRTKRRAESHADELPDEEQVDNLEDALDALAASEAPLETARVRLELAATLHALGRDRAARGVIETALATCRELGAVHEEARAGALLEQYRSARPVEAAEGPLRELSPRELEVLALVAEGLTNQEIAARLVISDHTVHRHVANILRKLDAPSRSAAAVLAAHHGLAQPPPTR